jgi:hypothetical protein
MFIHSAAFRMGKRSCHDRGLHQITTGSIDEPHLPHRTMAGLFRNFTMRHTDARSPTKVEI